MSEEDGIPVWCWADREKVDRRIIAAARAAYDAALAAYDAGKPPGAWGAFWPVWLERLLSADMERWRWGTWPGSYGWNIVLLPIRTDKRTWCRQFAHWAQLLCHEVNYAPLRIDNLEKRLERARFWFERIREATLTRQQEET